MNQWTLGFSVLYIQFSVPHWCLGCANTNWIDYWRWDDR